MPFLQSERGMIIQQFEEQQKTVHLQGKCKCMGVISHEYVDYYIWFSLRDTCLEAFLNNPLEFLKEQEGSLRSLKLICHFHQYFLQFMSNFTFI